MARNKSRSTAIGNVFGRRPREFLARKIGNVNTTQFFFFPFSTRLLPPEETIVRFALPVFRHFSFFHFSLFFFFTLKPYCELWPPPSPNFPFPSVDSNSSYSSTPSTHLRSSNSKSPRRVLEIKRTRPDLTIVVLRVETHLHAFAGGYKKPIDADNVRITQSSHTTFVWWVTVGKSPSSLFLFFFPHLPYSVETCN